MPLSSDQRRIVSAVLCLVALILFWTPGRAGAAESFSGDFGGVCFGLTNASGSDRHYSYWADYTVDGVGGLTGNGQMSKQGGAAPPVDINVSNTYQLFRREGVLMGLNGTVENRVHGRLSDDLEYGVFMPLHDNNDWYLAMIAPTWAGVPVDNSWLDANYWVVHYQLRDPSVGPEQHISGYGGETYDGLGNISGVMTENRQGEGSGAIMGYSVTYSVAADGGLTRYVTGEKGFMLDNGHLLATSLVDYDEAWGITLSVLKPEPGVSSLASLQGPYWLAMYQYNNVGGADLHSMSLGEAYFDGAGGVDMWINSNVKGFGLTSGYAGQTYTVAADGAFTLGSTFNGGVGRYNRVVIAAQANTENLWGIMVLLKRSGIEDPSPLCQVLGLAP